MVLENQSVRNFSDLLRYPAGLPEEFPCSLMHGHSQVDMELHWHHFSELVVILSGNAEHFTPTAAYPIVAGNVYLIQPGCLHGYRNCENLVLSNLCYWNERIAFLQDPALMVMPSFGAMFRLEPQLRENQQGLGRLLLNSGELGAVRTCLDRLYEELANRPDGYAFMAMVLFQELVVTLCRCFAAEKKAPARKMLNRLAHALNLIEQEYTDELDLQQIAQAAGLSKSHLIKSFREAFAMPPLEYLRQVRIQHAMRLLRETGRSITDVAYAVGFNDSNYFSRQFKKHTGQTPRAYSLQERK